MKIIHKNEKEGEIKILIEQEEDLWHLSRIINPGDEIKGTTERKIKIGGEDERKQRVTRKKVTLTIKAEKTEYKGETTRILGTIIEGPEDIPRGEHHTIQVSKGDTIKIKKEKGWAEWEKEIIEEATKTKKQTILAVIFDREEAIYAKLNNRGYEIIKKIRGEVQKKDYQNEQKNNFWKEIIKETEEQTKRGEINTVIFASPAFWKEYLKKEITEELNKKAVFATISEVSENGIKELIKRPELKTALENDRSSKETRIMEELLTGVMKEKTAYGLEEIRKKAEEGTLETLAISENLITKMKEEGKYEEINEIMKNAEQTKTKIIIISTEEAKKTLDGLSGIAGKKRW